MYCYQEYLHFLELGRADTMFEGFEGIKNVQKGISMFFA